MDYSIAFPNLGIELEHVGKNISVFGIDIAYYGIVIAIGMLVAMCYLSYETRRIQENSNLYFDFAIVVIICGFIGARLYYVAFSWDSYKNDLLSILNIREGGLAIYGGLIGAIIAAVIFTRIKKMNFWRAADVAMPCVLIGQIFGRWGNFFNREAFGEYTDSLFAMRLPLDAVRYSDVTDLMRNNSYDGYIQVTPTFLYESLWNLGVLILLLILRKHKKFDGQIFWLYVLCYGLGRFWIESLRTDQLLLPQIDVPVSMVVAAMSVIGGAIMLIVMAKKNKRLAGEKDGLLN